MCPLPFYRGRCRRLYHDVDQLGIQLSHPIHLGISQSLSSHLYELHLADFVISNDLEYQDMEARSVDLLRVFGFRAFVDLF